MQLISIEEARTELDIAANNCGIGFWVGTIGMANAEHLLSAKFKNANLMRGFIKNKKSYTYSRPECVEFLSEYMDKLVYVDPNLLPSLTNTEYLWRYEDIDNPIVADCKKVMAKNSIRSRYSLAIPIPNCPKLVYRFVFASPLPSDELNIGIAENKFKLLAAAHLFVAVSYQVGRLTNPYLELNMVNQKSKQVLDCIKQGMSRAEISAKLHMSPRGVDYHTVRLKNFFEASSLTTLVSHANQYGL